MGKEKDFNEAKKDSWLKNKYRVTAYNDTTLEQVWQFRVSGLASVVLSATFTVFIIVAVIVVIAFTSLREYIPGYPDARTHEKIMTNALRADSLERVIQEWERQLENINKLMSGQQPQPLEATRTDTSRTESSVKPINRTEQTSYAPSSKDSLLRKEVEELDRFNPVVNRQSRTVEKNALEDLFFFSPVRGVVSDSFNTRTNHLAVDVVAAPHAPVMSVLDGSVVMANWTTETGYVIQVQHTGDIISVYKHNEKLLKKQGDRVKAGEVIAIVGNSGELTTGPHLHFELWHKGAQVNPLRYIKF